MQLTLAAVVATECRFHIHPTVSLSPPCSWGGIFWKGGVGYVTRDMVASHLPPPTLGSDALVMVCGPPGNREMGQGGMMVLRGRRCKRDKAHTHDCC